MLSTYQVAAAAALGVLLLSASTLRSQDHDHAGMAMDSQHIMMTPLEIPMDRMGSGTTWIPDETVVPSRHFDAFGWDLTTHGFGFVQYNHQSGPRGDSQFGSLNWGMLMASHRLAGGLLQLRTMLSLDAAGVTERGYPLLLQTGEAVDGERLFDRQHPHDLFMELSALYLRRLSSRVGMQLYGAISGEPALGPSAFMHRPSAMDDPVAPIGHHWQDATHITFGVLTAGLFGQRWKVEGSLFNSREPDQERWDFDLRKLDSYSGRLTLNPSAAWSLTAGYGYLKSPEALEPDEPIKRISASALWGRARQNGQIGAAVVYGANVHGGTSTHSVLAETEAVFDRSHTLFGRVEFVQKSPDDLGLEDLGDEAFNIGAFSLGAIREVIRGNGVTMGVGVRASVSLIPRSLEPTYGSRTPVGALVFVRVRPLHFKPGMPTEPAPANSPTSPPVAPPHRH